MRHLKDALVGEFDSVNSDGFVCRCKNHEGGRGDQILLDSVIKQGHKKTASPSVDPTPEENQTGCSFFFFDINVLS